MIINLTNTKMWSELLQPLIALVQILLLSRDHIFNHFDHRFDDEAASDDDDSQRRPISGMEN